MRVLLYEMQNGPTWRIEWVKGDEYWAPSLWVHFKFWRKYLWLVIFFNRL